MDDSSNSTTGIIVGSYTERNSTRTGQWYNAGSRFRGTRTKPYTLWAAGLITPFVAPALCHMPIEVVSVRVREHPHEDRTPPGVVSWVIDRVRDRQRARNNQSCLCILQVASYCFFLSSHTGTGCIRTTPGNRRKSDLQTAKQSRSEWGWSKVVPSACPRALFPYDSWELDQDIADFRQPLVNSQQPAVIQAGAKSTTQRNRDRFNELTSTGTRTVPIHSSAVIFLCLQFVSQCHLWAFLFSSG